MTLQPIIKRLDAIELAVSDIPRTCHVCQDWERSVFAIRDLDGTYPNYTGSWPVGTFECPNCGRRPDPLITIGVRPDGPQ